FRGYGFGAQHCRPSQDVGHVELSCSRHQGAHPRAQRNQFLQQRLIQLQRLLSARTRAKRHSALDLAAKESDSKELTELWLNAAQFIREAELYIEITVIDRPQLEVEHAVREFARSLGISSHAVNHGSPVTRDW